MALLLSAAGSGCLSGSGEGRVHQPVSFPHAAHVSLNMDCAACHSGAREEVRAGLPPGRKCALCHSVERSDPPTPEDLADYLARGEEIPWVKVNRLRGNVHFSHVAHVTLAQIDCTECHGEMKERLEPVTESQIQDLDMSGCIDCHRKNKAQRDCLICHK